MQQAVGLSFLGGGHYLALAPLDRPGGLVRELPAQAVAVRGDQEVHAGSRRRGSM